MLILSARGIALLALWWILRVNKTKNEVLRVRRDIVCVNLGCINDYREKRFIADEFGTSRQQQYTGMLQNLFIRCKSLRRIPIEHLASFTRGLTTQETSAALRPFYFAVHPDLFGQHPRERAVNEDNLKKLNAYLNRLHSKERTKPTVLKFYVRQTAASVKDVAERFREVHISLLSTCPRETVTTVLRSCDLSVDHVKVAANSGAGRGFPRPVIWDKTFYDFYNIPNPYAETAKKKPEMTLSMFLKKNITAARRKQEAGDVVMGQIQQLQQQVRDGIGVQHVLWDSHWGPVQFRACLLSFLRILDQYQGEVHFPTSTDTIVFGKETGFSLRGHVILQCDEVPTQWLNFLQSVERSFPVLEGVTLMEDQLSTLLNNIQVVRPAQHKAILLQDYARQVARLTQEIDKYFLSNPEISFEQDLSNIQLIVDIVPGRVTISPAGQVIVPSPCPAFLIIDFLVKNATVAREARLKHELRQGEKTKLISQVIDELGLASLVQEDNITWEQMTECCRHLLEDPTNIGVSLEGCMLSVAQFYSVMSDGLICIPWNWKGVSDNSYM